MMRIDLCLCTFRRPMVEKTLLSVDRVKIPAGVDFRVIVIDNDTTPSAEEIVTQVATGMSVPVRYIHAPARNISIARNAGLDAAEADWVAFLDDDEVVPIDWLEALLQCQKQGDLDAVFGHSKAQYPSDAPKWITDVDYHSQVREPRGGKVLTGHTCNAILRWAGTPWQNERFEIDRGQSGGEDTAFFFALSRMGAKFAICDDADVFEEVPASRLSFTWLWRRKMRIGKSYVSSATGRGQTVKLFCAAFSKTIYCHMRALLQSANKTKRNFWLLRGTLHLGVCAGCLKFRAAQLYGN